MKLRGKTPGVHVEPIILPRPDGDLEFQARAIDDFDAFEQLCPMPQPPEKILPGNIRVKNVEDMNYLKAVNSYSEKRVAYMVVKGLSDGTEGLEWEQVKLNDFNTWHLFRKELRDSGLSDIEINRVVAGVMVANSLSERAVEEARKRFLASVQPPKSA
jgi:hypothetical protein